eukprot:GEZU01018141.1.p1 GENE.GEZU01018141.1~~GEZU01018141.1.p1  ORF type:complete len:179 (+),score=62.96 GEZU01018141.1:35-538(+)
MMATAGMGIYGGTPGGGGTGGGGGGESDEEDEDEDHSHSHSASSKKSAAMSKSVGGGSVSTSSSSGGGGGKGHEQQQAKKKKKDPNEPKRPPNSYMLFCTDKREEARRAHPEMKNSEITKILGEMWQKLSEDEKKPYVDAANQKKHEYEAAMKAYKSSFTTTTTTAI